MLAPAATAASTFVFVFVCVCVSVCVCVCVCVARADKGVCVVAKRKACRQERASTLRASTLPCNPRHHRRCHHPPCSCSFTHPVNQPLASHRPQIFFSHTHHAHRTHTRTRPRPRVTWRAKERDVRGSSRSKVLQQQGVAAVRCCSSKVRYKRVEQDGDVMTCAYLCDSSNKTET